MRFSLIRQWVERHFGTTLILSFFLGLFLPGIHHLPAWSALVLLAIVVFLSAFQMQTRELRDLRLSRFLFYYALRFILFPVALLFVARHVLPSYSIGLFLLALVPPGVSSPAFCNLLGGNVALALAVVVISTVIAPFLIPSLFYVFTSSSIALDTRGIFISLVLTVLLPLALHLPLRRNANARKWISTNGSFLSVLLIGGTILLVIAKRRDYIFSHALELFQPLAVAFAAFSLFYVF